MMNMIEKVAKAFYEEESGLNWEKDCIAGGRKWRLRAAKAAIEAMREPTQFMVDAGRKQLIGDVAYSHMIDAALKEE